MKFGLLPLNDAHGGILAHSVDAGGKRLRKGRVLSPGDIDVLRVAGVGDVMVAQLDADDVPEDQAAQSIAATLAGPGVRVGAAFTGRANLYALEQGVVLVDGPLVDRLNALHEAITVATLAPFGRVTPRQMVATVKIIPFAAPRSAVEEAKALLGQAAAVRVAAFAPRRAALISTFLPSTKPMLLDKNRSALDERLKGLGSQIVLERRVAHATEPLAGAIAEAKRAGCDPILVFGASAITDRRDIIPSAVVAARGRIDHFGMPVDPGNLLLLGDIDGATVVGLPGCARSPKLNGFDFILWRILAGVPVSRADITKMAVGGLLSEIPTRPQPRDELNASMTPHMPKIGAVVLAAGLSSRMGANKLLLPIEGKPMVRTAVEAAVASAAELTLVVTGKDGSRVADALAGLPIRTVENRDYAMGLSTSLKAGLNALPPDCDGALILLSDMPGVTPKLIDKLIAAFDPSEERAICVATRHGKRGNPVLWSRRFFPEMLSLEGDVGAKHLLGVYGELVCEVEAEDDAPLTDIDTPEALAAYRTR
jgi:molybdenum cofactor cytidylyltransferase